MAGGDEVDVEIELDTAPREVSLPRTSLLPWTPSLQPSNVQWPSYSNKSWHVLSITGQGR